MSEIIFCSDLQSSYAYNFSGGYEQGCAASSRFAQAAMARGLPLWASYFDFEHRFLNKVIDQTTPTHFRDACLDRFTLSGLTPEIQKESNIVFKIFPDTFSNSNFLPALKRQDVSKIVMIGCYLGDCLTATAVSAALRGFDVTIIQDLAFGGKGMPEIRADENYAALVRRCLRMEFVSRLEAPYPNYDIPARQLYRIALGQVKPLANIEEFEKEMRRCGPSRVDVARLYESQCARLSNLASVFDRFKTAHEMEMTGYPDFEAVKAIKIMTTDAYLAGLALRPPASLAGLTVANSL